MEDDLTGLDATEDHLVAAVMWGDVALVASFVEVVQGVAVFCSRAEIQA